MDIANTLWLDSFIADCIREGGYKRGGSKRSGHTLRTDVLEDVGFNEDTGDDIRRRERMAEAMYDV